MAKKYQQEFNLTDEQTKNMTFWDAYLYADAVTSKVFEGIQLKARYNATELYLVNTTQIYGLINTLTAKSRRLFVSKILERPLNEIKKFISYVSPPRGKYTLYSMHDYQIANILK